MAEQAFRIVHFSDVHVGTGPRSFRACFDKRLFGSLNYFLRRRGDVRLDRIHRAATEMERLSPDVVICSGDLTSTGTPEEFARILDLLRPIRRQFADRFVCVPGNHDVYVRDERCRRALLEAFRDLNGERFSLSDLPVRRRIGKATFFLVNGAHPTNPFLCSGTLGEPARQRLESWFGEARGDERSPRFLVNHFPLRNAAGQPLSRRRRLRGGDWLNRQLEQGCIDVSLCGHVHVPYVRRVMPGGGLEICAGSLTIAGKLNVLDYSFATGCFTQFWVDVSGDRSDPVPVGEDSGAVTTFAVAGVGTA